MEPRKMKILMMCAHPGDAFDDSGGTLCHHVERGDDVIVVIITTGARSHSALFTDEKRKAPGQRIEEYAAKTADEIEKIKADKIIAAGKDLKLTDIRFMHAEDDILLVNEPMIKQVAQLIREEKPDLLITHHPMQDGGLLTTHPIVGQIVMLGYEAAGARWTRDESLPPHQISQVFFIGTVNGKHWSLAHIYHPEWKVFVDVEDVVDRKVKALDHLASQRYDGKYARKRAEAVDGWRGTRAEVAYAEDFIPMIPEVYHCLPIQQSTLDAGKGWTDRINRCTQLLAYKVPYKGKALF